MTPRALSVVVPLCIATCIPLVVSNYRVFQLTLVMIYAIALTGLNLLTGYNGQISIGHGALFGLGAYTAVILILRGGVPAWLAVICAGAICFVAGWLFGRPALRLHGHYLALATFGLAVAMPQLLRHQRLGHWTGGVQGLVVPTVQAPFGLRVGPERWLYYVVLAVMAVLLMAAWNLAHSRVGRALVALRDHPIAAEAMGVPAAHYKTVTFGISSLYAGIAGALSALAVQFVAPESFPVFLSVTLLVGIIVGGAASISGAIYGAIFIVFVPNVADQMSKAASGAIYGLLLILTVFLLPGGIAQSVARVNRRLRRKERLILALATACALALFALPAAGTRTRNLPGITNTEIRIGQTSPYSGPMSGYSNTGRAIVAYFQMVNDRGGIHGRRVKVISLDDQYSPPKTLEQTRRLVEQEGVFLMFGSQGTAPQSAVHEYLNARRIPQLFVPSGARKFNDPAGHPWTLVLYASNETEGEIYAQWLLKERPNARMAILYQNDDFGHDFVRGFKRKLGPAGSRMIVVEQSYETSAPTIDAQMIALAGSGADTFFDVSLGKFVSLAIRHAYDSGWKPLHLVFGGAAARNALEAAGFEKASGLISAYAYKSLGDPQWNKYADVKQYFEWLRRYLPGVDPLASDVAIGYRASCLLEIVLERCGNDLTRENVMRQATNLKDVELPLLLPGVKINTSPTDYLPIKQMQLRRFDGQNWIVFGDLLGGQ
jgi:branched-chain amino acid transport system substrate-binding protein